MINTADFRAYRAQVGADGIRVSRGRTHRRNSHSSRQPTPYPMAALIPLIKPWNIQSRGSKDGETDAAKNTVANTRPT